MSENRVDLGNVKGDRGFRGIGIDSIVELPPTEEGLRRNFRINLDDGSNFEFSLTDVEFVRRVNSLSIGDPESDYLDVPTVALLKRVLQDYCKTTEVYRQEVVYTKTEVNNLISSAISNLEIIEVVNSLPTQNINTNCLYILTKSNDNSDELNPTCDLYIRNNDSWVKLDDLRININDYLTEEEVMNLLIAKQSTSNLSNNVSTDASSTTKYPSVNAIKTYTDSKISNDLNNYYTKTQIDNMIGDIQEYINS